MYSFVNRLNADLVAMMCELQSEKPVALEDGGARFRQVESQYE